jgi:hypothetical protein
MTRGRRSKEEAKKKGWCIYNIFQTPPQGKFSNAICIHCRKEKGILSRQ